MRKVKFTICIITVAIIVLTSLSQVISQNNQNMKKGFYLGPMNHYFLNVLETDSHNQWYRDLSYNMMQSYCAHFDTIHSDYQNNGQRDGGFFEDISNYRDSMIKVITKWHNIANDNSLIFEREKILRPAYGQRFTYQAEYPGTWHTIFPAYGYDSTNVTGIDVSDSNGISKHCMVGRDASGFMVKGLYENCSQTNNLKRDPDSTNSSGWNRLYSDIKQQKYKMRWFIKPRMRVDVNTIFSHLNDTLVKIYVKNFDGNYIDSFSIKGLNFLDISSSYDGRYLENFYNLPTNYHNLSVSSDSLAVGRVDGDTLTFQSKVDYQVKWLGKVDVWLDYVRVDDSWAHFLFTDTWENEPSNTANIWKFHRRIKEEVEAFSNTQGLGYFWVDEVQYPNLECIGEVNRLVKEYSANRMSLLFITDPNAFMGWPAFRAINPTTIVKHENWDICIDKAISCGALSDIMITQWFPFYYTIKYPEVLNDIPSGIHITGKVQKATGYSQYTYVPDQGVQPTISWLVRQHKYYIKKAKEKGLIYGVINQLNSDENNITGSGLSDEWGIREPTNEEISMILNTSMVYGAKVMLEFSYTSKLQDAGKLSYNWGLTSPEPYLGKRDTNYYGQLKWDFVAALNKKLKQTGDFMYPLNNPNEHLIHDKTITVNTVSYQSDCNECGYANYDYVNDIRSLAPLLNGINPCMDQGIYNEFYDCPEHRFWELGFFKKNQNSFNQNDKSKYLFAVNKRTYPVNSSNSNGDIRILKIKFNASQLTDADNWVIKEAITDSVLVVFNKTNTNYVTVASFEPGEGKLLRIAPVTQEGGTLVADETISGNVNCNGMIYNGGHNITISPNAVVTFSDSAGIEMNGGCFVSGVNADNADAVTLTGKTSTFWKGITLIGCDSIGVYNTNITNIKANDTAKAFSIINSYKVNFRKNNITANNNSGGIQAVYNTFSDNPIVFNIRECNFNMNYSGYSAISIFSNASVTLPTITEIVIYLEYKDV